MYLYSLSAHDKLTLCKMFVFGDAIKGFAASLFVFCMVAFLVYVEIRDPFGVRVF